MYLVQSQISNGLIIILLDFKARWQGNSVHIIPEALVL